MVQVRKCVHADQHISANIVHTQKWAHNLVTQITLKVHSDDKLNFSVI